MAGMAAAQPLPEGAAAGVAKPPLVEAVVAPPATRVGILPPTTTPTPPTTSPGDYPTTREARAHEQYLLQSQAQAESVHQAAIARAQERTRRLESQRWFGISNARPTCSADPFNGDYSPGWVSNYPFYPYRWVGSGEPWTVLEGQ
jgi:mRNA-degrading endonuclease toxin of MazEF toxin-antitoxin module